MALLDVFKHKNKEPKKTEAKTPKKELSSVGAEKKSAVNPVVKKGVKIAYKILESPHVTEKASLLSESNRYTFKVSQRSNKIEIKKAVEELYGINVVNVNIIKIHRKKKRVGKTMGFKKGYKKAIIEIKKGQKIEVMPR